MNRSLRHVARSPFLRVLAAFAWMLLVVWPVHGQAMAMSNGVSAMSSMVADHSTGGMPSMASANRADHCQHAAPVKAAVNAEDCCRGGAGEHGLAGSCHCAATAGSALAAVSMIELLPLMPADTYPSPRRTAAPDITNGPPLRPPTV